MKYVYEVLELRTSTLGWRVSIFELQRRGAKKCERSFKSGGNEAVQSDRYTDNTGGETSRGMKPKGGDVRLTDGEKTGKSSREKGKS